MAMQYINYIKKNTPFVSSLMSEKPVLDEEDEAFLNKITSEENPPALPPRPEQLDLDNGGVVPIRDAQMALMDGADNVGLSGYGLVDRAKA